MHRRTTATLLSAAVFCLVLAPSALAQEIASGRDYGEGWWGQTDDLVVTKFGFGLIAFFPLFIFTMSIIQWRLDKRKERRKAAAKARLANVELRGGY